MSQDQNLDYLDDFQETSIEVPREVLRQKQRAPERVAVGAGDADDESDPFADE